MASRLRKSNADVSGVAVSLGCAYALVIFAFWITVIVIALHFIAKFW